MKNLVLLMMSSLVILFGLSSCVNEPNDALVIFTEQENGVEPYQTRMIVTKEYVRVDDGEGATSFILYNRNEKVVYSINPDEKSVMAIHEKKLKEGEVFEPPFKLTHSVKKMPEMKDAPTIKGEGARHYQLITNDKICYDVVAIKNLMPNVVKALTEFHNHMATDSMVTFNNTPKDLLDACGITSSTFKPARQFEFGFPIQEWGDNDYSRSLMDYNDNYIADPKLFSFPEGYKHYSVQELREGKVSFDK